MNRVYSSFFASIVGAFFATALSAIAGAAATETAPPARHQVVVFYANETTAQAAQSANYADLLSILRSSRRPFANEIADALERDAREFPAAVRRDVDGLLAVARRRGFDLAVFSNALTLDQHFIVYASARGFAENRPFAELGPAPSPALAAAPLSRPDYLQAALVQVGNLYPPDSLDIILIANSHGAGDLALTPRVFADLTAANATDLMRELEQSTLQDGAPPLWAEYPGTTKVAFWRALNDAGRARGLRYPLVFREVCESGVSSFAELFEVPESVGMLAHTGDAMIGTTDIDNVSLFDVDGSDAERVHHLSETLRARGIHVDSRAMLWFQPASATVLRMYPYLLFLPLLLWLAWHGRAAIAAALRRWNATRISVTPAE